MDYHFIYLIKEKDDIDNDVHIYKIGKSCQANTRRVASYPSGSHLLLQVACDDCHSMETFLIKEFKSLFTLARGREYFEGDPYKMINLIFFMVQTEVNPHKIEYMMTDKYNMSLVCYWDNDYPTYSFNNKDNILDEYNRDLIEYKRSYKHLEIKYNAHVHDSRERIQSLEKENMISYDKGIEYYRDSVMPAIDTQYKSLEIEKNEEIDTLNGFIYGFKQQVNQLSDKNKRSSDEMHELTIVNKSLREINTKIKTLYLQEKNEEIDTLNESIHFLEKVNKGNNEKIDSLNSQISTMVNNSLKSHNEKSEKSNLKYKQLEIKYNKVFLEKIDLRGRIDQQLTVIESLNNKVVLENKRLEGQVTMELQNNLNQGNILADLQTKYKSSNRLYYGLFTYMLYNMSHHIYMYPYSVTNWLLLSGSSLFVYIDNVIHSS